MKDALLFIRKRILFNIFKNSKPHLVFEMVVPLTMVLKSFNFSKFHSF